MADYIFTDADMEANVLELGEWIEEMLEALEGGHQERPLCPPVWSNGTQVPLETLDDEDMATLVTAAENFGWDLGAKLGVLETSVRAAGLIEHEDG